MSQQKEPVRRRCQHHLTVIDKNRLDQAINSAIQAQRNASDHRSKDYFLDELILIFHYTQSNPQLYRHTRFAFDDSLGVRLK